MPQAKLIRPQYFQAPKKKRVAAYCRVSSNSADQIHSFEAQVRAYTKLIQRRSDWELVEIYADEGISGTQAENRIEFQRMIRACELHEIDLIITKSVSRFSRNAKESLMYVRKLKLLGVGVQFEKESINTLFLGDEMLINTFSAIAQEESKAISQNQRLSIVKRMEAGEYVDSNAPYGYRLIEKQLVIYEPEAEIIRSIFARYLSGWSTSEIARELTDQGIPTKLGKQNWKSSRVAYILSNERYIGDCRYQKTFRSTTVPFKQSKNRGQEDMYYARETHAPIISREVFQLVQNLLSKRRERFDSGEIEQMTYPLTSRIRCKECGSFFHRKIRGGIPKWVCSQHYADSQSCKSHYYDEERIYHGLVTMVNKLRFGDEQILDRMIQKLESTTVAYKKSNRRASDLSKEIADLNTKLLMLEQLKRKGYLAAELYEAQSLDLRREIQDKQAQRMELFHSRIQQMLGELKDLRAQLNEMEEPMEAFDEAILVPIVQEITIDRRDEMVVTLVGGLKFAETI